MNEEICNKHIINYEIRNHLNKLLSNKCKYDNIKVAIEEINQRDEETYEVKRCAFEKRHYDILGKLSALLNNIIAVSYSSTRIRVPEMSFHSESRHPDRLYLPKLL